jgi:protein gp37
MGTKSSIQWTDATWNVAVGCTKVDEDCKFCYMYRESLNGTRYDPKRIRKTKTVFNLPLRLKEPSKIFTSSLTDVFHEEVDGFRDEMWDTIRKCPQHTFQILTKRPERIIQCLPLDWGDGWDNVWLGTSIGSEESLNRPIELKKVPAKVRFLSIEPLWGQITLGRVLMKYMYTDPFGTGYQTMKPRGPHTVLGDIHWVIIGGESGNENGKYKYRPCELHWIGDLVHQCQRKGIPVFVKQLGTHLSKKLDLKDRHGGDIEEWPEHLRIRQFPDVNPLPTINT